MTAIDPSREPIPLSSGEAVYLRLPRVMLMTGLGRSTIYRLIAQKKFPHPRQLAPRAVGWHRDDLARWSAERPTTCS